MEDPAFTQKPPSRPDLSCGSDSNLVCCKRSPPECNFDDGYLCLPTAVSILFYLVFFLPYKVFYQNSNVKLTHTAISKLRMEHPILTLMMMVMTFLFPRLLILQCIHVEIKVTHVANQSQHHQLQPQQQPPQQLLLPRRLLRHVTKEMVTNALIFK